MSRWSIEAAAAAVGGGAAGAMRELHGPGASVGVPTGDNRTPVGPAALPRTAAGMGPSPQDAVAGGGDIPRSLPWLDRWRRSLRTSWRPHRLALGAAQTDADADAACAAFAGWCAQQAGSRLHLGLGAALVQICVAPAALARAELRDYAGRQLAHYFGSWGAAGDGGQTTGWTVAASGQPDVPLACAAPRVLVSGLQAAAREHGVRLLSLSPWWAPAAQAWLLQVPEDDGQTRVWLAREPGWITVLQARGRVLQRAWSEPQDGEWQQRLPRDVPASAIGGIDLAGPDTGPGGSPPRGAWLTTVPEPAR